MAEFNIGEYFTVYNIVVLVLVIIGLVWLISAIWTNSKINSIRRWPRTDATVINSLLEPESESRTFLNLQDLSPTTDISVKFIPRVLYSYTVAGRTYQSTNFMYGADKAYNALDIQTLMGHMAPNSTIQVYYNPDNPSESYIYNGVHNYTGVWMGLLLLAIAAVIAYYHNTIKKRDTGRILGDYDVSTPSLTDISPRATARTNIAATGTTTRTTFRKGFY